MKLPMFPLQSVFFPGERVALHIFEERYKQLIQDCLAEAITFGIPVYIDNTVAYGTEMKLVEIVHTYPNGEMDVVCSAQRVFKVMTFDNEMEGRLYAGGIVTFLDYIEDGLQSQRDSVIEYTKMLYGLMNIPFDHIYKGALTLDKLIHKIGLTLHQEYHLLKMVHESERLIYIRSHLIATTEVLKQVNHMKDVIEMNGHFKNFDPLDFKDFKI
ncbi:LON peptidase substrate-binding domain-containing protein [Sediminicola sp. 1XM1-17]|uniref:LON peptidase substrate-binding domain-containing protein n=1 Tax=Sediminicola sp. 1XM1-17 TaxID=3127702 RepID=UPI0030787117